MDRADGSAAFSVSPQCGFEGFTCWRTASRLLYRLQIDCSDEMLAPDPTLPFPFWASCCHFRGFQLVQAQETWNLLSHGKLRGRGGFIVSCVFRVSGNVDTRKETRTWSLPPHSSEANQFYCGVRALQPVWGHSLMVYGQSLIWKLCDVN